MAKGMKKPGSVGAIFHKILVPFAICYGLNVAVCSLYIVAKNEVLDRMIGQLWWISPSIVRLDNAGAKQIELITVLWAMFFVYLCFWFLSSDLRSRFRSLAIRWHWLVVSAFLIVINYGFFGYFNGRFLQFGRNGRSIFEEAVSSFFGAALLGNLIVVATLLATIYVLAFIRKMIINKE